MTLRIAQLRLRLPAGYAARAPAIARALAAAAARIPLAESRAFDTLRPAPIRVAAGASDSDVAAAAARSLAHSLTERP